MRYLLIFIIFIFLISGCVTQDLENVTPVECTIPSDCEGRLHIQCVGFWQCISNQCAWQCASEHLELPEEDKETLTG